MDTDPSLLEAGSRFASAARAFANQEGAAEVLALLAEQREWRVLVDGTRNLGHQASSVMLLRRLIELTDFSGRVVVVYVDHQREILGCTSEKLALLFPGVDSGSLVDARTAYGCCRDIRFLPFERRSELSEAIAFGFTGGADDLSVNYALELNVRYFVRLQPYLWDDAPAASGDAYYEASRVEQPDGRHFYLTEFYPEIRELTLKLASSPPTSVDPAVWSWYIETQTFDAGLACRARNARVVLTARERRATAKRRPVCLWPVYGLHHFTRTAAELFLACAFVALQYAAAREVSVVLCSFSPPEEMPDWADLAEALASDLAARRPNLPSLANAFAHRYGGEAGNEVASSWSFDCWTQAVASRITSKTSEATVCVHRSFCAESRQWQDIAAELEETIAFDDRVGVHLVDLGTIPMDIFQYFIAQGDMPSVIEGQASSNFLAVLGRPFLQILRTEHVIESGYPEPADDSVLAEAAKALTGMCARFRDLQPAAMDPASYCDGIDEIVSFICETEEPPSPVSCYFQATRERAAQSSRDKLLITLLALREVILAAA